MLHENLDKIVAYMLRMIEVFFCIFRSSAPFDCYYNKMVQFKHQLMSLNNTGHCFEPNLVCIVFKTFARQNFNVFYLDLELLASSLRTWRALGRIQ